MPLPRLVALALLAFAVLAGAAHAAVDETRLVSRLGLDGDPGDDNSLDAAVSIDGRYIAFRSHADNLSDQDDNEHLNLFRKDMKTGEVELVNVGQGGPADAGTEQAGGGVHVGIDISEDGRYVAFHSFATNLKGTDTDGDVDIFVRDVEANQTSRVTPGDDDHVPYYFDMSGDGSTVVYNEAFHGLYGWRQGEGPTRNQVARAGLYPSLNRTGTKIAYVSTIFVDSCGEREGGHANDIFVRPYAAGDCSVGTDITLNMSAGGIAPVISGDGNYVAFHSFSDFAGGHMLVRLPAGGGQPQLINQSGSEAAANALNSEFIKPALSHDGMRIAFLSAATNLHPGDTDVDFDVFVRDFRAGDTLLASRRTGAQGESFLSADHPGIDPNGNVVVFQGGEETFDQIYTRQISPLPPENITPPGLVVQGGGAAEPGRTLSCETGGWTRADSFRFRWLRDDAAIAGATGQTYVVAAEDTGHEISCEVTGVNGDGEKAIQTGSVIPTGRPCAAATLGQGLLCGRTPVIFVPGFGASELECVNRLGIEDNLYPNALINSTEFLFLELAPDGRSPDGSTNCSKTAGASGLVVREVLQHKNIHGKTLDYLDTIAPGHAYALGWDWRKAPEDSMGALATLIDNARAFHGVEKVAILAHSYGGLLTRWYIDDPANAAKVARVAAVGNPFWGAPKPWFAVAHGYESPIFSGMDLLLNQVLFKRFARNLAGLYFLFPSKAWYDNAPAAVRRWLEIDGKALGFDEVVGAIELFGGNGALARAAFTKHGQRITGFKGKQRAGLDWRVFAGSGVPTLGHIRETSDAIAWAGTPMDIGLGAKIAWINGDGTVPLISQRQFTSDPAKQMGEQVPTYYLCGLEHLDETEDTGFQNAVAGFLSTGADPVIGPVLKDKACPLAAAQFTSYLGREDDRSIAISRATETEAFRRSAGTGEIFTLREAETAGLVDIIRRGSYVDFVTTTSAPLTVTFRKGFDRLRVTPLVGDARVGKVVDYGKSTRSVSFGASGAKVPARKGARQADGQPPRTRLRIRRRGGVALVSARVRDASGVGATLVRVNRRKPVVLKRKPLRVKLAAKPTSLTYRSIDVWGNAERPRRAKLPGRG